MRLAGKVAIISGAASGVGAATAWMFVREGAKVVIADVFEHEGRQVAEGIGASARFELLDVTNEESWAAAVATTTRNFGKLDILVNNAGISGSAEQDFYSTEAWHRIMAVNATVVFFGIKYAIPAMVANGGGSIVSLSSIAGIIGKSKNCRKRPPAPQPRLPISVVLCWRRQPPRRTAGRLFSDHDRHI
jgi:NAD(P)-dependent dehydrogenase (short-subunit alcohol dehydrogenase family)